MEELDFQNTVSHERIRSFFIDERLPADWKRPEFTLGFFKTLNLGGKLRAEMDKIIADDADAARKKEAKLAKANGWLAGSVPQVVQGKKSLIG